VDLLESRVGIARSINPAIDISVVDASAGLPFPEGSFDLVTQFVAFSSMLDHSDRTAVAAEMTRCLSPSGWVLSYDAVKSQPGKIPDGLSEAMVAQLFPGATWLFRQPLHNIALVRLARRPLLAAIAESVPGVPKRNLMLLGRR